MSFPKAIQPTFFSLWAKTDNLRAGWYHPLLFHMLDVAAVASIAWESHLSNGIRRRLQTALGGGGAAPLVAFLAGAHDIGKASPAFQGKVPALSSVVTLLFSENDQIRSHGFISAHAMNQMLGPCPAASVFAQIVGGHHGIFPRSCDLRMGSDSLGNHEWKQAREELLCELARLVGFDVEAARTNQNDVEDPFLVPTLAGFVSVVDWIASNQKFFPCTTKCGGSPALDPEDYWRQAQEKARKALEDLGWLPTVKFATEAPFDHLFPKFPANEMQRTVIDAVKEFTSPYLLIVEAPMGHGKTEAALYATDLALCRGFARGLYIAMPTQATSNAMFSRVLEDYLRHRGHEGRLNVQLVHGNALLADVAREGAITDFKVESIKNDMSEEAASGADLEARSWFTAKKRPLLAPFGVGTIDQSLLSVLQTKHWFVRMFGLAGKVVIFDEVHAYDAYMSTILERLLHWLAEIDCTVILLSATLPEARRRALVAAYSGRSDAEHSRYPRLTLAHPRHHLSGTSSATAVCVEIPPSQSRILALSIPSTDMGALSASLTEKLRGGGCAAVICNTVNRAIEVFKHLRDNLSDTECLLFHARTLQMWRREREEEVLRKFGKDGSQRPPRAVLVATQVVEQSLDLDFDLMVSDMAPIDLLLQRSGRLHRHPRERPRGLESPELLVLCDAGLEGPPPESFGKSIEYVYDRYVLLRTWLAIRGRSAIEMPSEIEGLVESVYAEDSTSPDADWSQALAESKDNMNFERSESEKAACRLLVSQPRDPSDLIEAFNDQLTDDEDPEVHRSVRAATREGDPSLTIVMPAATDRLSPAPSVSETRQMLDHSAKISHRGLFRVLLDQGRRPQEWVQSAHLRHARLVRLDSCGEATVGTYALTVDQQLGIVIEKGGEANG
jgi:CRISPR-associated endonuclease/helicase Cas3